MEPRGVWQAFDSGRSWSQRHRRRSARSGVGLTVCISVLGVTSLRCDFAGCYRPCASSTVPIMPLNEQHQGAETRRGHHPMSTSTLSRSPASDRPQAHEPQPDTVCAMAASTARSSSFPASMSRPSRTNAATIAVTFETVIRKRLAGGRAERLSQIKALGLEPPYQFSSTAAPGPDQPRIANAFLNSNTSRLRRR